MRHEAYLKRGEVGLKTQNVVTRDRGLHLVCLGLGNENTLVKVGERSWFWLNVKHIVSCAESMAAP